MPTKAELEIEVETLQNRVQLMEIEKAQFEDRVREVAMLYAKEHELCDVVRDALRDAGIPLKTPQVSFKVTKTWHVSATLAESADHAEFADAPDQHVADSIIWHDGDFIEFRPGMHHDYTDVSVECFDEPVISTITHKEIDA